MGSRVVVVLPTETYRAADFVEAARALGIELTIASESELPLLAADRQVRIDCSDPIASAERVADVAATTPVDAIVAADDAGVEIAARASELIGLPASPVAAVRATLDKSLMRHRLEQTEITQPAFEVVDRSNVAAAADRIGFPVVTKPRTRTASVGVMRADDHASLVEAATLAARHQSADDGTERFLVERFVGGPEISLEGLLWDGGLETLAIFDKPDQPDGPVFPETILVTPSSMPADIVAEVERTVGAATRALGLTQGPVHAELRIEHDVPVVLEIAGRTIGGLCGRSLRFGLMGDSLESLVLRQALGERKRGSRRLPGASGVLMIPVPLAGRLSSVEGVDAAESVPGVTSVEISIPIGAMVQPTPDGDRYLGFIFARAGEPADVVEALRAAHARLTIVVT
ncbi:MAG: ATP-grasp domain-containing protein [Acidimicrobiia bacterium]|nr:ATP-grasp domain-containing protein [Acidimicrobiia bacterium]